MMFPCHPDHYNAGCDKSDNNFPAMLCYSGRSGLWKNRISPLFWLVLMLFSVEQNFILSHLIIFLTMHFFHLILCAGCKVGQRVVGVKHWITAGALDVCAGMLRQSSNSLMRIMKALNANKHIFV